MDLFLMRHGIAEAEPSEGGLSDRERPLSPKGLKRTRQIAGGLAALKLSFDRILTSPLVRARETAQIVAESLNIEGKVEETSELAPDGSVQTVISRLAELRDEKSILLVGHQPLLGEIASFLLSRGKGIKLRLRKGGLCCLEVDDVGSNSPAILHWVLTSKQLRLIER
jgi:phosphohistidine phosphatase